MSVSSFCVLGTPLQICTYASLTSELQALARSPKSFAVEFANTHVVTMRRYEPQFREITSSVDYFIPDGMPLVWCLNRQGAKLRDRVYGPTFMRECVKMSPTSFTHYFLGRKR
jgi:N-acetylglucosaminyldiphosphoundecaprenol N-acetyl-beta-D-mannosaminyltransferase